MRVFVQISELYTSVLPLSPLQGQISSSLDYVESQQKDLAAILDSYEEQIGDLVDQSTTSAGWRGNSGQAEKEREKACVLLPLPSSLSSLTLSPQVHSRHFALQLARHDFHFPHFPHPDPQLSLPLPPPLHHHRHNARRPPHPDRRDPQRAPWKPQMDRRDDREPSEERQRARGEGRRGGEQDVGESGAAWEGNGVGSVESCEAVGVGWNWGFWLGVPCFSFPLKGLGGAEGCSPIERERAGARRVRVASVGTGFTRGLRLLGSKGRGIVEPFRQGSSVELR